MKVWKSAAVFLLMFFLGASAVLVAAAEKQQDKEDYGEVMVAGEAEESFSAVSGKETEGVAAGEETVFPSFEEGRLILQLDDLFAILLENHAEDEQGKQLLESLQVAAREKNMGVVVYQLNHPAIDLSSADEDILHLPADEDGAAEEEAPVIDQQAEEEQMEVPPHISALQDALGDLKYLASLLGIEEKEEYIGNIDGEEFHPGQPPLVLHRFESKEELLQLSWTLEWLKEAVEQPGISARVKENVLYLLGTYGMKPSSGYQVSVESMISRENVFLAEVDFKEPSFEQHTLQVISRPHDMVFTALPAKEEDPLFLVCFTTGLGEEVLLGEMDVEEVAR